MWRRQEVVLQVAVWIELPSYKSPTLTADSSFHLKHLLGQNPCRMAQLITCWIWCFRLFKKIALGLWLGKQKACSQVIGPLPLLAINTCNLSTIPLQFCLSMSKCIQQCDVVLISAIVFPHLWYRSFITFRYFGSSGRFTPICVRLVVSCHKRHYLN